MGRYDRKATAIRKCVAAGLTRAETTAKVKDAVRYAAAVHKWDQIEHALALADWYRAIDRVYKRKGNAA